MHGFTVFLLQPFHVILVLYGQLLDLQKQHTLLIVRLHP
jgi:hypothetical protein